MQILSDYEKLSNNIVSDYEKLSKVKGLPTIIKIESRKTDFDISFDRRSRFYDLLERLDVLNL